MTMISGGNVISAPIVPVDTKDHITWIENAVPTDANVGGGYRTPVNGELAANITTGAVYERQAGAWVKITTVH